MPGYLLEKIDKREKEGSHNISIYHKLNNFHKSDSQMGATRPTTVFTAAQLRLTHPGWAWDRGTEISPISSLSLL